MVSESPRASHAALGWFACNLLGWFNVIALMLVLRLPSYPSSGVAVPLVLVLPGLAQWLLLRRFLGITPLWMLTIPLASIVFVGLIVSIPHSLWQVVDGEATVTIAALYAIFGALIGLVQWPILRRRVRSAWIWVATSAAGLGLGFALALSTGLIDRLEMAGYTAVVLVYAACSAGALAWLLSRPARAPAAEFIAA
jgi:hypothetical protein